MLESSGKSTERMTLADLELWGLSPRSANCLEMWFGMLYVDEARCLVGWMFRGYRGVGTFVFRELQIALRNHASGVRVKTVEECLRWR